MMAPLRLLALGLLLLPSSLGAQKKVPFDNPDFTRGGSIPARANHDWNLGPTGARGWIYSNKLETTEARQIYITQVAPGSPADSVLRRGDVLVGVGEAPFRFDPRTELGRAIGDAEAKEGKLVLRRWRQGKTTAVTVPLPTLGAYAATAPFACAKSKRILEQGCAVLARRMQAAPTEGHPIVRAYNALALLASGNREYLPLVKDQVRRLAKFSDPGRQSLHSWVYGPTNILLAEYTLATGDATFRADLRRMTGEIARGQSAVGSWGHKFVQDNRQLSGYGMMNAPGLPLILSMALAREAGVTGLAIDQAITRSARLIRFYVGKGSVPYGDHAPWTQTHDDNGKNGVAGVLFHLLGDREAADYFSRMSLASHGAEREMGHTGNFFNMLWALPGVALQGPQATGAWMKEFGWYYDLARGWDGSFRHQGPPQGRPDKYSRWDATGAYLLAFAQPLRQIYLTGKERKLPAMDAKTAQEVVEAGRGFSQRLRHRGPYAQRSDAEILRGLRSWSPVVRERCAAQLKHRKTDVLAALVEQLASRDLHGQLGSCQALAQLGPRAATAVPALRATLHAPDLWLRIKAAEALAAIGAPAMPAVPQLLRMIAKPVAGDVRGMQQRYVTMALFNRRGLLGRSLQGVDRQELLAAVREGLQNEDGRARGALASVYKNLSFEEIEPLLPVIHEAVVTAAPSGVMFADGIRLAGLELLARHRIAEGLPLCVALVELNRWGSGKRIARCLKSLRPYGAAAKVVLPDLEEMRATLSAKAKRKRRPDPQLTKRIALVEKTIASIRGAQKRPQLRRLRK